MCTVQLVSEVKSTTTFLCWWLYNPETAWLGRIIKICQAFMSHQNGLKILLQKSFSWNQNTSCFNKLDFNLEVTYINLASYNIAPVLFVHAHWQTGAFSAQHTACNSMLRNNGEHQCCHLVPQPLHSVVF